MTLFKQIAILVSSIFLILLIIVVRSDLLRTAEFQQGQLQTTAQDMATTLGIAIERSYQGQTLSPRWSDPDKQSAFFGRFGS